MIRLIVAAMVFASLVASCNGIEVPATIENAAAAYIRVSEYSAENQAVIELLSMAREGEPREQAGFIRGLRAVGRHRDANGVWGREFIFHSDITVAQRQTLAENAASLNLDIIWLHGNDEWPWCEGEDYCERPKDSGDYP